MCFILLLILHFAISRYVGCHIKIDIVTREFPISVADRTIKRKKQNI